MSSCNLMQYVPQQTSHIVHSNGCGYIVIDETTKFNWHVFWILLYKKKPHFLILPLHWRRPVQMFQLFGIVISCI
jgi:hypothetical protein